MRGVEPLDAIVPAYLDIDEMAKLFLVRGEHLVERREAGRVSRLDPYSPPVLGSTPFASAISSTLGMLK